MAPQTAQPTAAPSATQQPTTQAPVQSPAPSAPTATVAEATVVAQPTTASPTQTASATSTTTSATTSAGDERILALQEPRLQGDDVRAVQQRLLDLGYWQVGAIDGVFGPQTEVAVRTFQEENGLQVDGVVGPQTCARLFDPAATTAVIPIVVHSSSSYLLGAVQSRTWLDAPAAAPLLTGGERYRVLTGQTAETTAIGSKPEPLEVICTDTYTVSLEPAVSGDAAIAVGGTWPLQPHPLRELAANDPALQQAVATFLQGQGIAQPDVQITHAATIDLEGDASDEIVMAATRLSVQDQDPTNAAAGDYSFVAVQKTVNGQPTMVEIAGNYFPQAGDFVAPNEYRILGILDLNGDGVIEVVVNGAYYEGAFTSAFQVEGNAARELLTTGCGV
jgi:peptidoglycan hydrolase-like protein with peptidoglycan-binding domain